MTYQEIKNRLAKCELALSKIKDGTYSSISTLDQKITKEKLEVLKESYLKLLKEQDGEIGDDGFVSTDDEKKAADLAKDGVKVKLTSEQEGVLFSVEETKAIAKEVGKALIEALRAAGDEIETIKAHHIEENTFDVYVRYKNDFEDEFTFDIRDDKLHLVDFSFDKELVDVGIKPSGQPIINVDVLKNELLKHFKSLNEEETDRQKYLRMLDMYKKSSGQERKDLKDKVLKAANQVGIKLQLSEAPEGMFYLKVDIRDARHAIQILDDKYRKQVEFSGSDTYYFNDESTAYDAMMDLKAHDIGIADTNLDLFSEEEEFINHPQLALNILKKIGRETFVNIYKKYQGTGQSRNQELKKELMDLVMPEVKKLNLNDSDEEKVMNMLKRGLASLEASMMRQRMKLQEGRGVMASIKNAIEELMFNGDMSEKEAAMELVIAISDEYGFDLAGREFDLFHGNDGDVDENNLKKLGDQGFNIGPSKKERKAKALVQALKAKRAQVMKDMEQEAEPEGGPMADKYGDMLNKIDAAIEKLQGQKQKVNEESKLMINGKPVDVSSIEIDGVDKSQGYDDGTVDAFAVYAEFEDGSKLTDSELEELTDDNPDLIHNLAIDTFHESAPGYKHDCAAHVVHETYGHGMCIPEKHTLIKEGNKYVVTHYDVVFKKDKKVVRDIPVNELKIITQNEHWHKNYKKKKKD
jgi:hypothetical protein